MKVKISIILSLFFIFPNITNWFEVEYKNQGELEMQNIEIIKDSFQNNCKKWIPTIFWFNLEKDICNSIISPIIPNPVFWNIRETDSYIYNWIEFLEPTNQWCFTFNSSTKTITNYSIDPICPKSIVIPSKINWVSVENIGDNSFFQKWITNIIIPNSVKTIWNFSFMRNNIVNITFPESITSLWVCSFYENDLIWINIPNSITTMNTQSFSYNQLQYVILGEWLTEIDGSVFFNNSITNIDIPSNITSIKHQWLAYNLLEEITIPSTINTLWGWSFESNTISRVIFQWDTINSYWPNIFWIQGGIDTIWVLESNNNIVVKSWLLGTWHLIWDTWAKQ